MATVVIIGRPNVGKSTLFNRLVGGRVAITLKEPGITRDRLIHTANWRGREFTVIDTGGFIPDAETTVEQEIARQVKIALQEAAVVIMVVDGTIGILPLDQTIAEQLRRQGIDFLLAVNKCDLKHKFDIHEFHRLGGTKIFPISAEHGIGIDELLDEVIARLPASPPTPSSAITLAIVGRPNVGKSTLLNRLLGKERAIVTPEPGTTRDPVEDTFEFEAQRFQLIDTAGIRRRSQVNQNVEFYAVRRAIDAVERCTIAVVVIDATEGPTAQDKKIINLVTTRGKGLVIAANKSDLIPQELIKKVREYITAKLNFVNYAPVVYTVATTGKGILDLLRQIKAIYHSGGMRLSRRFLSATLLAELKNHPPALHCRVLAITQTGVRPPTFRLRLSRPDAVTTTYQRYILNLIRQQFKFTGYPIRLNITD